MAEAEIEIPAGAVCGTTTRYTAASILDLDTDEEDEHENVIDCDGINVDTFVAFMRNSSENICCVTASTSSLVVFDDEEDPEHAGVYTAARKNDIDYNDDDDDDDDDHDDDNYSNMDFATGMYDRPLLVNPVSSVTRLLVETNGGVKRLGRHYLPLVASSPSRDTKPNIFIKYTPDDDDTDSDDDDDDTLYAKYL